MKKVGIIAEYNPFHNGHEYHIKKSRELTGADAVIIVMSGNFVQRGDAAICDKHTRAKMALLGGADLVVELPCVYSCQSAERFAKGGTSILKSLDCDYISFGIEDENLDDLKEIVRLLKDQDIQNKISTELKKGISYPKAISNILGTTITDAPNNILGIEYLKSLDDSIKAIGIQRKGSMHDQEGSASDIRKKLQNAENIESLMPDYAKEILKNTKFADKESLDNLIMYKLRTISAMELKNIPDVTEGLENRIIESALKSSTIDELYSSIKTKRYTMARIRRIAISALLGITNDDIDKPPQYIRVLGMNNVGKQVLAELKGKTDIPVITKMADAKKCRMLEIDTTASDIYSILTNSPAMTDYKKSPIIV